MPTNMTIQQQAGALAADEVHQLKNKISRLEVEAERLLIARIALAKGKSDVAEAYIADAQSAIETLLSSIGRPVKDTPYTRKLRDTL